jgi:hypothetical protein
VLRYKPSKHKPVLERGTRVPKDIVICTTMLYNNNNKNKKKWGAASNAPKK